MATVTGLTAARMLEIADSKSDVGHKHDASDIVSGTLDNLRLPARLQEYAETVTDWNSAITNGWVMGLNAENSPGAGWWLGYVEAHNPNWVTQTVHAFSSGAEGASNTQTYRRAKDNGTWSAWYRLRLSETEQAALWAAKTHQHSAADITSGEIANARLPDRLREVGPDISGTNLNTLRFNGWARGSNMTNSPLGTGWWYIYNEAHDTSGWRYQRIIGYTGTGVNTTWERQYQSASTWTSWRMIAGIIGWQQLPLSGGWGTDQSGPNAPSISRHGQMVVFRGRLRDGAAGSVFTSGLPNWALPSNEYRLPITNNSGIIESSSWINVWPNGQMASGGWTGITSTCSWPAKD